MQTIEGLVADSGAAKWVSREIGCPGKSEVLIRIQATGVNRADLMQLQGLYPAPPGYSDVMGLECAGTIEAVGEDIEGWQVGDRVCALLAAGGYASHVICDARQLFPLVDGWSFAQGAGFIEAFATAWLNLYQIGCLVPGEKVLVYAGASGVGSAAIQLCQAFGNPVTALAGNEQKREFCLSLGAETVVLRDDHCWDELKSLSPFDLVLDPVAGDWLQKTVSLLGMDGRLILIGLMGGTHSELNAGHLLMKRIRLQGSTLRSRSVSFKGALLSQLRQRLWQDLQSGRVRPLIDRTFSAADIKEAFSYMAENRNLGKIIIDYSV